MIEITSADHQARSEPTEKPNSNPFPSSRDFMKIRK